MCGRVFVGVIYAKVQFAMSQATDEMCLKQKSTLKHVKKKNVYLEIPEMYVETLVLIFWLVLYFCYSLDVLAVACHSDVTRLGTLLA